MGACTIFAFIYPFIGDNETEPHLFILGTFAGIGLVFGRIFIALAVAEGQAGPSQAIMSTNSVYLTIFAITIDKQIMTQFQLLGLIFGISGAFVIATGDKIKAKLCGSKKPIEKVEDEADEEKGTKGVEEAKVVPDEEKGAKEAIEKVEIE